MIKLKDKLIISLLFILVLFVQGYVSNYQEKNEDITNVYAEAVEETESICGALNDEELTGSTSNILNYTNNYNSQTMGTLPSRYCLRDDYFIYTQNQTYMGLCWDFTSGTALATSSLLGSNKYYNFSESYAAIAYSNSYSSYEVGEGGTFSMYNTAAFNSGVVLEQDCGYEKSFLSCAQSVSSQYKIFNSYADPNFMQDFQPVYYKNYLNKSNPDEILQIKNSVKYHIKNYSSLYLGVKNFSSKNCQVNGKTVSVKIPNIDESAGHAISIIGWDDNFSVSDYSYTGAWIILNSWGNLSTSNIEGISYVFYDDPNVSYNSSFWGYVYSPYETGNYYYDEIVSSTANLQIVKNKYYTTGTETNTTAKNGNIFYKNDIDLTFKYHIADSSNIKEIIVYSNEENITNLFLIEKDLTNKTIRFKSNGLPCGSYKVIIRYGTDTITDIYMNEIFVCDGTEIERFECYRVGGNTAVNGSEFYHNYYGEYKETENIYVKAKTGSLVLKSYPMYNLIKQPTGYTLAALSNQNISNKYYYNSFSYDLDQKDTYVLTTNYNDGTTSVKNIVIHLIDSDYALVDMSYELDGGICNLQDKLMIAPSSTAKINSPTRNGYKFIGWYKDSNSINALSKTGDEYYISWSDICRVMTPTFGDSAQNIYNTSGYGEVCTCYLYADWEEDNKKDLTIICVDPNGNETSETISAIVGESLTNYRPQRENLTFDGWFTDNTFNSTSKYSGKKMPDSNLTLYYRWFASTSATCSGNGVFKDENDEIIYASSKFLPNGVSSKLYKIVPETHYHIGKVFVDDEEIAVSSLPKMGDVYYYSCNNITRGHTLYVEFEIDKFNINYHYTDENGDDQIYISQSYDYGSTGPFVLPDGTPTLKGHTFNSWCEDSALESAFNLPSVMPDYDIDAYAKFDINKYKLTYNFRCADIENVEVPNIIYNTPVNLNATASLDWYIFDGWYKEESLQNLITEINMPDADTMVYAKWQYKKYTIFAYPNYDYKDPVEINIEYRGFISLDAPSQRENGGYTFEGWYLSQSCKDGEEFTITQMPANNIDVYAKWTKTPFNITFINEGETIVDKKTVLYKDAITYPTGLQKQGHSFNGWYTTSNFETNTKFEEENMPANNLTLYACWTKNSYTITYHYNYDMEYIAQEPPAEVETHEYDEAITILPDRVRESHIFHGWYTSSECNEGEEFSISKMPDQDLDVYAKWEIKTFNITLSIGEHGRVNEEKVVIEYNKDFTYLFQPEAHYHISKFVVDNNVCVYNSMEVEGEIWYYSAEVLKNVKENHEITVEFAKDTYIVNIEKGDFITLDKESGQVYEYGELLTINVTLDAGCELKSIIVLYQGNETEQDISEFDGTFNVVVEKDITIKFEAEKKAFTVKISTDGNGKVSPNEERMYEFGTSVEYQITPNEGYTIFGIKVDGEALSASEVRDMSKKFKIDSVEKDCEVYIEFTKIMLSIIIGGNASDIVSCEENIQKIEYGDTRVLIFDFKEDEKTLAVEVDGIRQIVKDNMLIIKNIKSNIIVKVNADAYPFYMTKVGMIVIASSIVAVAGGIALLSFIKRRKHLKMSKSRNDFLQKINSINNRTQPDEISQAKARLRDDVFSTKDMFGNISKKGDKGLASKAARNTSKSLASKMEQVLREINQPKPVAEQKTMVESKKAVETKPAVETKQLEQKVEDTAKKLPPKLPPKAPPKI